MELSDECFKACVDPQHKYYTYTEEKCVKKCTESYFRDFEKVVLQTNKRLAEENEKAKDMYS
jgi:hypothetical protein